MDVRSTHAAPKVTAKQQQESFLDTIAMRDINKDDRISSCDLTPKQQLPTSEVVAKAIADRPEKFILLGEDHTGRDLKTQEALFAELNKRGTPFVYAQEVPAEFRKIYMDLNKAAPNDETAIKKFSDDFDGERKLGIPLMDQVNVKTEQVKQLAIMAHRAGANVGIIDAASSEKANGVDRNAVMANKLHNYTLQQVRDANGKLVPLVPSNGKVIASVGAYHAITTVTDTYRKLQKEEPNRVKSDPAGAQLVAKKDVGKKDVVSIMLYPINLAHANDAQPLGAKEIDYVIPRDVDVSYAGRAYEAAVKMWPSSCDKPKQ